MEISADEVGLTHCDPIFSPRKLSEYCKTPYKYTVVCGYKDTLYKDNMAEIWPKPTLFDFGPSLNKDNMAKNAKRSFFQKISKIHLFFIKIWVKS